MQKTILCSTAEYHGKLKKLCEPLNKKFGINQMSFLAVHDKVEVINVHTNISWIEHCLEHNYYKCDPTMVHPSNMISGFATWSSYLEGNYASSMLHDAIYKFNMCNGFSYVEKHGNSYQIFGFTTSNENHTMQNKVINNLQFFKKAITQLQQQIQHSWLDLLEYSFDGPSLKGEQFYTQPGIVGSQLSSAEKIQFLKKIHVIENDWKNVSLSPQESRCIKLYLEGNTAEQTASKLNLSRRTVEGYMENIKDKLGCRYKKDLRKLTPVFECLNIIDPVCEIA